MRKVTWECAKCGFVAKDEQGVEVQDLNTWWGHHPATIGYGPEVRCVELVPKGVGPNAFDLQPCGGPLTPKA